MNANARVSSPAVVKSPTKGAPPPPRAKPNAAPLPPPVFRFMPLPDAPKNSVVPRTDVSSNGSSSNSASRSPEVTGILTKNQKIYSRPANSISSFPSTSFHTDPELIMKQPISMGPLSSSSHLHTPLITKSPLITNNLNTRVTPSLSSPAPINNSIPTTSAPSVMMDHQPIIQAQTHSTLTGMPEDKKSVPTGFPNENQIKDQSLNGSFTEYEEEEEDDDDDSFFQQFSIQEIPVHLLSEELSPGEYATIKLPVIQNMADADDSQVTQIELPKNIKVFRIQQRYEGSLRTFVVPMALNATAKDLKKILPRGFAQIANSVLSMEKNFIAPPPSAPIGNLKVPVPMNEMISQPYLVNPKQYSRIIRRREVRRILEDAGKLPKTRQKYLHESRRQHALKRVRGEDGRFDKGGVPGSREIHHDDEPMHYEDSTEEPYEHVPMGGHSPSYSEMTVGEALQGTRTMQAVPMGMTSFNRSSAPMVPKTQEIIGTVFATSAESKINSFPSS